MANLSTIANLEIGPNRIPPAGTVKTANYTLAAADSGEYVQIGADIDITIPNATFSSGDVILLFNQTAGTVDITCSTTNTYIAGIDRNRGSITLAPRGMASLFFIAGDTCYINGNVT